jgi:hypothetical protein
VRWLGQSTRVNSARQVPLYLTRLNGIIQNENDPSMVAALEEFSTSIEEAYIAAKSISDTPASE